MSEFNCVHERESSGHRRTWDVPEVARILGCSRNHAYRLVQAGIIPSIKLGDRRVVVPDSALRDLLGQVDGGAL
jgi:excisionase family DNA binding protein